MSTPVLVTLIITAGVVLMFSIPFLDSLVNKNKPQAEKVWHEGYIQGRLSEKEAQLGVKPEYHNPYAKEQNNNGE